jgi:hypothetical protein
MPHEVDSLCEICKHSVRNPESGQWICIWDFYPDTSNFVSAVDFRVTISGRESDL